MWYCLFIGTVMSNRKGLPYETKLKNKKPQGTVEAYRSHKGKGKMLTLAWYDKRKVLMLTTKYSNNMVQVPVRYTCNCYYNYYNS